MIMKADFSPQSLLRALRQRPVRAAVLVLAVLGAAAALFWPDRAPTQASSYYEAKRGDFLVSVVEGGTLEAVKDVSIRCEVEGTARIIYIVPEGSTVKKGDLLVELDSAATKDAVDQQQLNVERAQFALIQAEQQLAIQKSVVESEMAAAELKVEFAETDLKKYLEGTSVQARQDAEIEITNVLESLAISRDRLQWTKKLAEKGFETKSTLDKDELTVSQGELRLKQAIESLRILREFDEPKQKRSLEAALKEAKDNLERVKMQGERRLAQFQADVETQRTALDLTRRKLDRDLQQLKLTKIFAPQDGLVVYAIPSGGGGRGGSDSMIEEGATVRNRQELIKLPDVADMKLQVRIHESHINQIRLGQPAYIVLDSMPDQRFSGVVNKVAPLPDSQSRWTNPNLKVYVTEILITDDLPDVKPGVSARAEIVITNLLDVVTVPIHAVTTRKGQQVVFLADAPQKPVPVEVGLYNIKFIEIVRGLNPGDRVLLAPPYDTDEKDLGGNVLAAGESPPANDTNAMNRALERLGNGANRGSEPAAAGDPDSYGLAETGDGSPGMRGGRRGRGNRGNFEEMLRQFDANGDGQLDDAERATMRGRFGSRGGRSRGETNSPGTMPDSTRP